MAKTKYYWDANVFISYIKGNGEGENRTEAEMEGIYDIVQEIKDGKAVIVTSTLTTTEVFSGNLNEEQRQKYNDIFTGSSIVQIDVYPAISKKASEIREHYSNIKKIKTPDAIHLATAILTEVDCMHAFDGNDLLQLNGDVMGDNLKICKPELPQKTFTHKFSQIIEKESIKKAKEIKLPDLSHPTPQGIAETMLTLPPPGKKPAKKDEDKKK